MKFLTVDQLSKLLQVKPSTLYAWASRGAIPSCKLNGLLRFEEEEIETWVRNSKVIPVKVKKIKTKSFRKKEINTIINRAIESSKHQGYNSPQQVSQAKQAQKGNS